ncbi:MAG: GNAT family N-acetyltransferase [Candidatus Woykebacteria bacterium]
MKIRETQLADYEQITQLLRGQKLLTDFSKEAFAKMLVRNKGFYLVAESNGKLVGTVFGSHDGGLFGYVYRAAVAKEFQNKGVGAALVKELLSRFSKADITQVFARIHKNNGHSLSFFQKMGFKLREDLFLADSNF